MKIYRLLLYPVFFTITLTLFACSSIVSYSVLKSNKENEKIEKIAVFPFVNETGKYSAGKMVTNTFIAELFKVGFFDVEEKGNVEKFFIREKIMDVKKIGLKQLKKINNALNVDAVIIGAVEEFAGGDVGERLPTPSVTIRVKLVDVRNGKIIWMAKHRRTGDHYISLFEFGKVRSVGALTKRLVIETLKTMKI